MKVEFEKIADELAALIKPLGPHAGMYESIPEHTRLVVTRAISALRSAAPKPVDITQECDVDDSPYCSVHDSFYVGWADMDDGCYKVKQAREESPK